MIFQCPDLGRDEEVVLGEIRELWRVLRFNLQQKPSRWTGLLGRNLRARAIQGSNSIEGYFVSREDARAAVDGDAPQSADEVSWVNVVHYREAMDYVLRLAHASDFAYTRDLIRGLHFIMVRHAQEANPGTWRTGAIWVRNSVTNEAVYQGPQPETVGKLAEELADCLTKGEKGGGPSRMVRAAMAHLNLVMIHPFSDGNGRMARCLQTLVLARGGVLDPTFSSIEEYLGKNTQDYYSVLAQVGQGSWNPGNDARPWVRFCLTAHYRQAKRAQQRLDRIAAIGEEVEAQLSQRGLPLRAATSLVNAAMGWTLRNSTYRHDAGVSMQLGSRDLQALVEAGLLEAKGEKRGRTYFAAAPIKLMGDRHRYISLIEDPFVAVAG